MTSIWRNLRRGTQQPYKLTRLVDHRYWERSGAADAQHVICDIDKTYLETEFENLLRMIRIAFEAATDKITVTGASEVLLTARWGARDSTSKNGYPRPLHFVSSSPPQLRGVLEEKLMLDGLDWSSDTFKNQVYNIRMRRMDLLRQHVAYKSLAILRLVLSSGANARFYLLGDNAESDAYIYTGIKLLLDGRLSRDGYRRYLEAAGVEAQAAMDVVSDMPLAKGQTIAAILIRNVPGYQFVRTAPLTDAVQTFDNFYQAALLLAAHGLIEPEALWDLTRKFHNLHGMSQRQLRAMLATFETCQHLPKAAREAAAAAASKLMPYTDTDVSKAFRDSLAVDLERFNQLTEPTVLENASTWMAAMRS